MWGRAGLVSVGAGAPVAFVGLVLFALQTSFGLARLAHDPLVYIVITVAGFAAMALAVVQVFEARGKKLWVAVPAIVSFAPALAGLLIAYARKSRSLPKLDIEKQQDTIRAMSFEALGDASSAMVVAFSTSAALILAVALCRYLLGVSGRRAARAAPAAALPSPATPAAVTDSGERELCSAIFTAGCGGALVAQTVSVALLRSGAERAIAIGVLDRAVSSVSVFTSTFIAFAALLAFLVCGFIAAKRGWALSWAVRSAGSAAAIIAALVLSLAAYTVTFVAHFQ